MSDYTPTLEDAKRTYAYIQGGLDHDEGYKPFYQVHEEAFDRMIAEVEREAAARARGEALNEVVQAHRNLHKTYGSTSACRGGIGGQAITSHCGEVCDNYEAHEKDTEAWTELEVEAIDYSSARAEAYRQERGER